MDAFIQTACTLTTKQIVFLFPILFAAVILLAHLDFLNRMVLIFSLVTALGGFIYMMIVYIFHEKEESKRLKIRKEILASQEIEKEVTKRFEIQAHGFEIQAHEDGMSHRQEILVSKDIALAKEKGKTHRHLISRM